MVQSDEDSDEIDEYESSDNDENIENTQYHDSLSCSFLSDIESEHELDNKKKENISDNNKEKNKKQGNFVLIVIYIFFNKFILTKKYNKYIINH